MPPQPSLSPHVAPGGQKGMQTQVPAVVSQTRPVAHVVPWHVPPHPSPAVAPHGSAGSHIAWQHEPPMQTSPAGHIVPPGHAGPPAQ